MAQRLSDKGLAVFAFAAYHQLTAGEAVKQVVLQDDQGHEADGAAVEELQAAGLATATEGRIRFTESGLVQLEAVVAAMRGTAA